MLAETFRRVDFVWSAEIDWGLVARCARRSCSPNPPSATWPALPDDDGFDVGRYEDEKVARLLAENPGLDIPSR